MRKLVFAIVLLLAAPALPMAAHAQSAKDKAAAEKFFRAGERAYKGGQYLMAAQAFEEALKRYPVPAIIFSTAQAYRLQYFIDKDPGWLKRAIELYRQYIDKVAQGGRRDDATASLAELEPILSRIQAEQAGPIKTREFEAQTQILVNSQVEGARATIDGDGGEVPLVRKVTPGSHKVRVEAKGYFPVEQSVAAVEGRLLPIEVELKPMPAKVKVRTENGARVSIDGRAYAGALSGPISVAAGKHFVSVSRSGRHGWGREITVNRGQEVDLDAHLETTTQRKASWWVMGAAGAVYIAAGVTGVQALLANSDASDLNDKRQSQGITPAELVHYQDLRARRDARLRDTYVLAGIGSAIAVTGVLMYLFDEPQGEMPPMSSAGGAPAAKTGVSLSPVVGGTLSGLVLSGQF